MTTDLHIQMNQAPAALSTARIQTDPLQNSLLGPEAAAVRGPGGQGAQPRPKRPVSFEMSVMSTKPSGVSGATS